MIKYLVTIIGYLRKRTSNYGFWISLASLIPLALQTFGISDVLPENYDQIVNGVLSLIVAIGICNNPTTKAKFFSDDCDCNKGK